jgi:hypothetical protein
MGGCNGSISILAWFGLFLAHCWRNGGNSTTSSLPRSVPTGASYRKQNPQIPQIVVGGACHQGIAQGGEERVSVEALYRRRRVQP